MRLISKESFCFAILIGFVCSQCPVYVNPVNGLTYDIGPLTRSNRQQDWVAENTHVGNIYFNFCAPTQIACLSQNQAVCDYRGKTLVSSYGFGSVDSAVLSPLGILDGITLTYSSSNTTCASGSIMETIIDVKCNSLSAGYIHSATIDLINHCTTHIDFRSYLGCGQKQIHQSNSPTLSPMPSPSVIHSDSSTNLFPVLIGSNYLGSGFNILQQDPREGIKAANPIGSSLSKKIVGQFSYSKNATWTIKHKGTSTSYSIPDQIYSSKNEEFGVYTYTHQSVNEYIDQASKNFGIGIEGVIPVPVGDHIFKIPIGASGSLTEINKQFTTSKGTFAVVVETIPLYNLRLFPMYDNFDPDFVTAVSSLVTDTSDENMESFLSTYGTHIQTGVTMGGRFGASQFISRSTQGKLTEVEVGASFMVSFVNAKIQDLPMYAGVNKEKSINTAINNFYKLGGDPSISKGEQCWYRRWVDSVPAIPAAVQTQIASIIPFMSRISEEAAESYSSFLKRKIDALTLPEYESPANVVTLYRKSSSYSGDALYSIPVWTTEDDDDCMQCAWAISTDGSTNVGTHRGAPSLNSWKLNGHLGSTGYSPATYKQSSLEPSKTPVPTASTIPTATTATTATTTATTTTTTTTCSDNPSTVTHSNGQCGFYPCIPGLDTLGIGYDIVTGSPKLPAFQWTFNNNKIYHDPYNNYTYAIPDQISMDQTSTSTTKKNVFTSFTSFASNSSTSVDGWDGLVFQFGPSQQSVSKVFDGSQSILGIASEEYVFHSLQTDSPSINSQLHGAMADLPTEFDFNVYMSFISTWGTHICNTASYGGKVVMRTLIDQEYFLSYDSSSIETTLGFQIKNWGAGIGWGNTCNDDSYSFSTESFQWITFYGGAGSLALTNQWEEWKTSSQSAPAKISQHMIPIQNFAPSQTISNNIERIVQEYYSKSNTVPLPAEVLMDMSIKTVSGTHLTNNYQNTCDFKRDWKDIILATSARTMSYSWSTSRMNPILPLKVGTQTCYKGSSQNECPDNSFIGWVVTEYPTCEWDSSYCADRDGKKPVLCGALECYSLYYEI